MPFDNRVVSKITFAMLGQSTHEVLSVLLRSIHTHYPMLKVFQSLNRTLPPPCCFSLGKMAIANRLLIFLLFLIYNYVFNLSFGSNYWRWSCFEVHNRIYMLGYILNPSTSFPSKSEISLRICLF